MKSPERLRVGLLLAVFLCGGAWAVSTEIWTDATTRDFVKGRAERLSIDSAGRVFLAPNFERARGIRSQYVWSLTQGPDGTLYAAGGSPGIVYQLSERGRFSEFYRTSEMQVHCVAVDAKGNVYAGTSPRGILYKITPKKVVTIFHDAQDAYIWAMAFDPDGQLVVATGRSAKLLRIAPDGKVRELLRSGESHFISMAVGPKGDIYAGSEPNGLVYHLSTRGRATVLHDADQPEARALALRGNRLYFGTASAPKKRTTMVPSGARSGAPSRSDRSAALKVKKGPTNGVYEIDLDTMRVLRLADTGSSNVLSLASTPDGRLYIGTGEAGKLFRIGPDLQYEELVLDLYEKQILCLLPQRDGSMVLSTANSGSVMTVESRFCSSGTYTSTVHDADVASRWGKLAWDAETAAGTAATLQIRTGNSRRPDSTWSPWSKEHVDRDGSDLKSPSARFVQYKVNMRSSDPRKTPYLHRVNIAYLPANLPPKVAEVKRDGETAKEKKPSVSSALAKLREATLLRAKQSTKKDPSKAKLMWKASDPNGDQMDFRLYFRASNEQRWKPLGEKQTKTTYEWDTMSVPDGRYRIKVVASDAPDNPPDTALSGERVSDEILVDNTRPFLQSGRALVDADGRATVTGTAVDGLGRIAKLEVSVDGGPWVVVSSADGILDSLREPFAHTTVPLERGEHSVVIRMTDAAGNVGAGRVHFSVMPPRPAKPSPKAAPVDKPEPGRPADGDPDAGD